MNILTSMSGFTKWVCLVLWIAAILGCSERPHEQPTATWAIPVVTEVRTQTIASLLASRYSRKYWLSRPGSGATDQAQLSIGDDRFHIARQDQDFAHFDGSGIQTILAQDEDPEIRCLCLPEYTRGMALYDQWHGHVGWVLFAGNHNALALFDVDGRRLIERRFQRSIPQPGTIFAAVENTADLPGLTSLFDF